METSVVLVAGGILSLILGVMVADFVGDIRVGVFGFVLFVLAVVVALASLVAERQEKSVQQPLHITTCVAGYTFAYRQNYPELFQQVVDLNGHGIQCTEEVEENNE